MLKPADVVKKWLIIDAADVVLGRLASEVAKLLRGKHKASYTPHVDCGDNVIIINAERIRLTGKKRENKIYYKHTGYVGGIKETTPRKILEGRFPERVVEKAIERMLPKESALARQQFSNLRVYKGNDHPHEGQSPEVLDIAGRNPKNCRSIA